MPARQSMAPVSAHSQSQSTKATNYPARMQTNEPVRDTVLLGGGGRLDWICHSALVAWGGHPI